MMTREQIVSAHPLLEVCQNDKMTFRRAGKEFAAICPFHADKSPSFRVNIDKGVWTCDPCGIGGSVIDYVAKRDGTDASAAMKKLGGNGDAPAKTGKPRGEIVKTYGYTDEIGTELYQVCRMDPKDFRQRHMVAGEWKWSMEGVTRVLYNLPKVMASETVFVVEGEKDADNLNALSLCATCNVGGAGKWMDGYTEALKEKHLILIPDNDDPGRKHIAAILESVAGKVKSTRQVKIPEPHKDVSDFLSSFTGNVEGAEALLALAEDAPELARGINLPIKTMGELEQSYKEFIRLSGKQVFAFGSWLPSLRKVRPLVPGDLVTILAATGVGKTMLLFNLALHARPLDVLLFELELAESLTFERLAGLADQRSGQSVWDSYEAGGSVSFRRADHIAVCPVAKLTPEDIERLIVKAELKIGRKPAVVLVDYIGLVKGKGGSAYERRSEVAEELKVVAKSTGTILVIASQCARKQAEGEGGAVGLHDAKDSGSIENSSGLVMGCWRDKDDGDRLWLKVLKNTKGTPLTQFPCRILPGLQIEEEIKDKPMI